MNVESILIALAIFAAAMFLWHVLSAPSTRRASKAADYTYREMAGELTADEIAAEAAEERHSRERLASNWSTYSDLERK